MQGLETTEDWT